MPIKELARTHDVRALPEIIKRLDSIDSSDSMMMVYNSLLDFGPEGVAQVCALLHSEDVKRRRMALRILGSLPEKNNPVVLAALVDAMHDPDATMRVSILDELSRYTDPLVQGTCLAAIHDPDTQVRLQARDGLKTDEPRYLAVLHEQLERSGTRRAPKRRGGTGRVR